MKNPLLLATAMMAGFVLLTHSTAMAQEAASTNSAPPKPSVTKPAPRKTQADQASKTASFQQISKSEKVYADAIDAHALESALKMVNKEGAFKGTVTAVFEPRGGGLAILNFDPSYRKALTALVRGIDFGKFPVLTNLIGREVLVKGNFISYQGRAEIVLTNASQIVLVEGGKKP